MADESLFTLSATELARLTRSKELSSRELVRAHIARLEAVNPRINAIVARMYDQALERAARADERAAREPVDKLPPFHGVPCTLKGAFAVEGQPWVVGSWYRREVRATSTATAVRRYLEAGAIPLCLSNVPEALTWVETENLIDGRTENPHRAGFSAGGSSGGEAAIIAAGGAPFGLGTDFGASIRLPAYFCGIAGHKPTGGLVPGDGQWPETIGAIDRITCIGPMARRARDLFPLLRALAPRAEPGPEAAKPGRTRVFFHVDNGESRAHASVRQAVRDAALALEREGFQVEEWRPRGLSKSTRIWMSTVAAVEGVPPFTHILGNGDAIPLARELLALPFGRSRHTFPTLALAVLEKLARARPEAIREDVRRGEELRAEIEARLGPDGVLLGPPYSHPPVRHHFPKLRPFNWVYGGIYNVLELPSTVVPTGRNAAGLPMGVQVTAARGRDGVAIGVALRLERPVTPAPAG